MVIDDVIRMRMKYRQRAEVFQYRASERGKVKRHAGSGRFIRFERKANRLSVSVFQALLIYTWLKRDKLAPIDRRNRTIVSRIVKALKKHA